MNTDLIIEQIEHDLNALAEEQLVAASNERLWAKGADSAEEAELHEQTADHYRRMSDFYRYLASRALDLIESYMEEE